MHFDEPIRNPHGAEIFEQPALASPPMSGIQNPAARLLLELRVLKSVYTAQAPLERQGGGFFLALRCKSLDLSSYFQADTFRRQLRFAS